MTEALPLTQLRCLEDGYRWQGMVQFPDRPTPISLLVFRLAAGYVAVAAYCPHQGADLSGCRPQADGCLVCPWHGQRIPLQDGFTAIRSEQGFAVIAAERAGGTHAR